MRWLMLVIIFVVRLAMGYQFQSVASVATQLVDSFGFSYAQVGTLIGFFLLPGVFMAMPSGILTRSLADKTLLIGGAAVMTAGAVVMALAETPEPLYAGRLLTGVGGTVFNLMLAKMVTDWFAGKEIITAMSIMLVAWPVGIALALLTQGRLAQAFGWPAVMFACAAATLVALLLTAGAYRAPPRQGGHAPAEPLRFGVPVRQAMQISLVGICWACYNAGVVLLPSFGPGALTAQGWSMAAAQSATSLMLWTTLVSVPLGGRLMEKFGHITLTLGIFLALAAGSSVLLAFGVMPAAMLVLFGLAAGVPGGALMALTNEALTPAHRGPGLGIFYTWYYAGMAIAPAVAGGLRDASGNAAAPVLMAGALMAVTALGVLLLRGLQARWPVA